MTPLGVYERKVRELVDNKWHIYLRLRADAQTFARLNLVFYVNQKGKVEGLRVIDDKESIPLLNEVTIRAIEDANLPPIPPDVLPMLPDEDNGRFKIEYNVIIY
ncbi:MAG: hypothetical protein NTY98_19445 [Verrucomicrobia bacterium]|nr:hypothetical protein [Verrucomicrobiota bacterium]